jgi:hypothetical protein
VQPTAAKPKVRNLLAGQLPLAVGRKVAFRQPTVPVKTGDHGAGGGDSDPDTWILAVVTQCISPEKNRSVKKEVCWHSAHVSKPYKFIGIWFKMLSHKKMVNLDSERHFAPFYISSVYTYKLNKNI